MDDLERKYERLLKENTQLHQRLRDAKYRIEELSASDREKTVTHLTQENQRLAKSLREEEVRARACAKKLEFIEVEMRRRDESHLETIGSLRKKAGLGAEDAMQGVTMSETAEITRRQLLQKTRSELVALGGSKIWASDCLNRLREAEEQFHPGDRNRNKRDKDSPLTDGVARYVGAILYTLEDYYRVKIKVMFKGTPVDLPLCHPLYSSEPGAKNQIKVGDLFSNGSHSFFNKITWDNFAKYRRIMDKEMEKSWPEEASGGKKRPADESSGTLLATRTEQLVEANKRIQVLEQELSTFKSD